jgi:hypothetical protein
LVAKIRIILLIREAVVSVAAIMACTIWFRSTDLLPVCCRAECASWLQLRYLGRSFACHDTEGLGRRIRLRICVSFRTP